jgi:hypothetical protein
LSGSSVATALAAGLAALILSYADIVDCDNRDTGDSSNWGSKFRKFSYRKSVFTTMSRESNGQ